MKRMLVSAILFFAVACGGDGHDASFDGVTVYGSPENAYYLFDLQTFAYDNGTCRLSVQTPVVTVAVTAEVSGSGSTERMTITKYTVSYSAADATSPALSGGTYLLSESLLKDSSTSVTIPVLRGGQVSSAPLLTLTSGASAPYAYNVTLKFTVRDESTYRESTFTVAFSAEFDDFLDNEDEADRMCGQ